MSKRLFAEGLQYADQEYSRTDGLQRERPDSFETGPSAAVLSFVECLTTSVREKLEAAMDWRVFFTTFGMIFLAEMGDKTQLAAMAISAQTKQPWVVLVSSSLALVCVSALGVAFGALASQYFSLEWIKRASAIVFIIVGVLILLGRF